MTNYEKSLYFSVIILLFGAIASGCGSAKPTCKVPDALIVEIETSDRVNSNEAGESLPTIVRLYQLKDISALEMSSFNDIWTNAEQSLGESLMGVVEATIFPGQRMIQKLTRNSEANFIVGAAVFRKPAGTSWRTIQELPTAGDPCAESGKEPDRAPLKALRVRIYLEDYRVESVANFEPSQQGTCRPEDPDCIEGVSDSVPDELGPARPGRGLSPFKKRPKRKADRPRAPSTGRRRRPSDKSNPTPDVPEDPDTPSPK